MNLWESKIGISGLVWGPFRAFLGTFGFQLMIADFALSGVIATCPFTIYTFLVLGF